MPPSILHIVAAVALPLMAGTPAPGDDRLISELFELSRASNAALMKGDIAAYQGLISLTDDFVLMSPFGGKPTFGKDITQEAMERMGRFFRRGDLRLELTGGWVSGDIAVLALIERSNVEVGPLPQQEWALRVTLVYRKEKGQWKLAHRHADPLVGGVTIEEAARLAVRPAAQR